MASRYVNIEDTVFILHMRIRMLRDLLRLEASPDLFLDKTLDDLVFIDGVLEFLTRRFVESSRPGMRGEEYDNLSDLEWQFSNLLAELSAGGEPFPSAEFPQVREKAARLRRGSEAREALINETGVPAEQAQAEPLVSTAEMSELLRDF